MTYTSRLTTDILILATTRARNQGEGLRRARALRTSMAFCVYAYIFVVKVGAGNWTEK